MMNKFFIFKMLGLVFLMQYATIVNCQFIGDAVEGVGEAVGSVVEGTGEAIGSVVEGTGEAVGSIVGDTGRAAGSVANGIVYAPEEI